MKIHLIAIGGSAMHNLAIALKNKGYTVTGSDDQIFEPSKSRLEKYGLLPIKIGWNKKNIKSETDSIIVGMHAKENNPELIRAKELKLKIYSYPEYIFQQSQNKKRIVISGSHGRTSITAMILHVLQNLNIECDYMVGAQLNGFDVMVKLTNTAPLIILEGDEYLSSPIDKRPKFHLYKPHIAVLSGIAWDHINVFPTFKIYINQFRIFKNMIKECLIYCEEDIELKKLSKENSKCKMIGYKTPKHKIVSGITYIKDYKLKIFGNHNLQNLNAAKLVCRELGITSIDFYNKIQTFAGASNRLELIKENKESAIYKDFAHSPSKLKATIHAMKKQFKNRKLIACMELHTFSSLNKGFINEYNDSMKLADQAIVFISDKAIKHKKLDPISEHKIKVAFNQSNITIVKDAIKLSIIINKIEMKKANLLMMSSGNFENLDYDKINL